MMKVRLFSQLSQVFCITMVMLSSKVVPFNKLTIEPFPQDSNKVIALNKKGYESRLNAPEQALNYADQALQLAKSIRYEHGEAEAYRIRGIARYYLSQTETAVADYLLALELFIKTNNKLGEARVLNNIGNLYLGADYDKALDYFSQALKLAKHLQQPDLLANVYLNIGNIYTRKKKYSQALNFYERGHLLYEKIADETGITNCLQNRGKIYFELQQLALAEQLLTEALLRAKAKDLNVAIASINLSLSSLYISKKEFQKARSSLREGMAFANLVKDSKLIYDFQYTYYELELKQRNYQNALGYLQMVYKKDSLNHANNESSRISLLQEQFKQRELQREHELISLRQKQNKIILLSTLSVTLMLIVVIVILSMHVRKKIKMNMRLRGMNQAITKQKEDLNRMNVHLEELIDERTKDLRIKNKKLSEYSAHLSHEIRGPVASMKGLLILEEEKIIEHEDLIQKLSACIELIDKKIHHINDALNDPDMPDLSGKHPGQSF